MNTANRRLIGIIVVEFVALIALGFGAVAAIHASSPEEPVTVIDSPASNSTVQAGDAIAIQSTSTDPTGITRVELGVDGTLVRTDAPTPPQASFTVTHVDGGARCSHHRRPGVQPRQSTRQHIGHCDYRTPRGGAVGDSARDSNGHANCNFSRAHADSNFCVHARADVGPDSDTQPSMY